MLGLDYAGSSPGAAAVKAAGYGFVARYLSRYTSKVIKAAEYNDMTGNGVGVVLVFEDYANQALNGYSQGVSDAQFALAQARGIGWPENRPIHFAVDFDISDAQKPAAGEYMKGAISVLGLARTGAYGGFYWIKYCDENNLASPNARWQAVAWSGGQIHPTATLFQQLGGTLVNGTACDVNQALKNDFGQNNIGTGENDMVPDKNHLDALFLAFRNRYPSQEEYDAYVGKMTYSGMIEALNSGDERSAVSHAVEVGEVAISENWQGQIATLENEVTIAEQAQADAVAAEKKAEAELKALQDQTNTDTQTGNSFLRWLGSILSKMKGSK